MLLELSDIRLNLSGAAGAVEILRGVNAGFEAGQAVAVVGPSGSGKTSLMMICAGLLKPTSGQVVFDGVDITRFSEDDLADVRRDKMGIVFQNFHLIPTMTAVENVAIPMELAGVQDADVRAQHALENVGLGHRTTHYPAQLSGGEQQRVAIARALAMNPKMILADEPTGNLDQETGKAVIRLLFEQVRERGGALMLITHDMDLAAMCDVQVHIKDGVVIDAGG